MESHRKLSAGVVQKITSDSSKMYLPILELSKSVVLRMLAHVGAYHNANS